MNKDKIKLAFTNSINDIHTKQKFNIAAAIYEIEYITELKKPRPSVAILMGIYSLISSVMFFEQSPERVDENQEALNEITEEIERRCSHGLN